MYNDFSVFPNYYILYIYYIYIGKVRELRTILQNKFIFKKIRFFGNNESISRFYRKIGHFGIAREKREFKKGDENGILK